MWLPAQTLALERSPRRDENGVHVFRTESRKQATAIGDRVDTLGEDGVPAKGGDGVPAKGEDGVPAKGGDGVR